MTSSSLTGTLGAGTEPATIIEWTRGRHPRKLNVWRLPGPLVARWGFRASNRISKRYGVREDLCPYRSGEGDFAIAIRIGRPFASSSPRKSFIASAWTDEAFLSCVSSPPRRAALAISPSSPNHRGHDPPPLRAAVAWRESASCDAAAVPSPSRA